MKKSILYMTSELIGVSLLIYKKVQAEAKRRGIPLICYCGNTLHDEKGNITPDSKIYDFVNNDYFLGVIINGGTIGQFSSSEYLKTFTKRFGNVPIVSLSFPVEGISNIIANNYDGIYNIVNHLIKEHNYKNIAFIKGPEGHPEAEERFKAYKDALSESNIALNTSIIASGDFTESAGEKAIESFFNSKNLGIEAIACVDDDSALGAYRALKKKGIQIPSEIAITGFDDIDAAVNLSPPLSTVKQPYEDMLSKAFDNILNNNTSNATIPAVSIIRESCGCINKNILRVVEEYNKNEYLDKVNELIVSFEKGTFLETLNSILEKLNDSNCAHDILSIVYNSMDKNEDNHKLIHQGRILINNISIRKYSANKIEFENLTTDVNNFLSLVAQVEGLESLKELLLNSFPGLGIEKAIIVLFTESKTRSSVFVSHGKNTFINKEFNSEILVPKELLDLNSNTNLVVLPLVSGDNNIGYGIYSTTPELSSVLATINTQIAGEINLLNLQNQRQIEKFNLENRNKSIQDVITPMLDRIKKVSYESNEEMNKMEEIKKVVGINSENFNKTLNMVKVISEKIGLVMNSISIINDISENINVLAINTSIQAAHAGDYGKGFSVIAKEIRRLSDSTAKNAEAITQSLEDTNKEFKNFSDINKKSAESFQSFTEKINHFIEIFNTIADNMEILSENSLNIIDMMES